MWGNIGGRGTSVNKYTNGCLVIRPPPANRPLGNWACFHLNKEQGIDGEPLCEAIRTFFPQYHRKPAYSPSGILTEFPKNGDDVLATRNAVFKSSDGPSVDPIIVNRFFDLLSEQDP